jgi:tetratricopeptide (TPR) repeat protein
MRVLPRFEQSLAAYDQAIKLNPQMSDAWAGRAAVLNGLKRHHDSVVAFERLLQLVPDGAFIKGKLVHQKMLACEWSGLTDLERSIDVGVRAESRWLHHSSINRSSSAQD